MNPIGHATKGSNNKITNGKTSTYGKKLGTSNNIFVSDHAKDPMTESPTKKQAWSMHEFQKSTNIFGGRADKKIPDQTTAQKKGTNVKSNEIVGNCPVDH